MDNITHSLTGALAAKIVPQFHAQPEKRRTLFWLLVLCANLPDIDWVLRLVSYFYYLVNHRGITHSLVFAPVLALLPAYAFYRLSSVKEFRLLWVTATTGVIIHIFFDLITSFGTMLLAPFSHTRYALDWMFIVDPVFTGVLVLTMMTGKLWKTRSRVFVRAGAVFAVVYLLTEFVSHRIALGRIEEFIRSGGISISHYSALPQPLGIFRWNGLVQTEQGVRQSFFSIFDDSLTFTEYKNSHDAFVEKIAQTEQYNDYLVFARHPWIQSYREGERHVVELRDLQFSVHPEIVRRFGAENRQQPFLMQYDFSAEGELRRIVFDKVVMFE